MPPRSEPTSDAVAEDATSDACASERCHQVSWTGRCYARTRVRRRPADHDLVMEARSVRALGTGAFSRRPRVADAGIVLVGVVRDVITRNASDMVSGGMTAAVRWVASHVHAIVSRTKISSPISSSSATHADPHSTTTAGRRETRRTSVPGTMPYEARRLCRAAEVAVMNATGADEPTFIALSATVSESVFAMHAAAGARR